jgi:hypothetical protein
MHRARALAAAGLIVFYGAVGARQPAVRVAVPLPVPAEALAAAAELPSPDLPTLLLHLTRVLHGAPRGGQVETARRQQAVGLALSTPQQKAGEPVPLPLDPSIWRDTILERTVPDEELVAAIISDRRAALLYYGLSALNDETLAWLGPDRATLEHLRDHPGVFAAFGRSIRVEAGHVVVPGGAAVEPLWASLVGVEPAKAAAFVQRLFRRDGRLAFFFDTIAHLDPARQRLALGLQLPAASQRERLRALFESFASAAEAWDVAAHPFTRQTLDGAVMLAALHVTPEGDLVGPRSRRMWERVFHDDELADAPFTDVEPGMPRDDPGSIDAAWLASRIARVPNSLGRRRLDVVLFAQRVFHEAGTADPAVLATALRGVEAFPALALTLERLEITNPATYVDAARSAELLTRIKREASRRTSIMAFQSALGIIERAHRSGGLAASVSQSLVTQLSALHKDGERAFTARLTRWLQTDFITAFSTEADGDPIASAETAVREALAGISAASRTRPEVEWEGRRYFVDPASAEARRLGLIREEQGGITLDDALTGVKAAERDDSVDPAAERALAETLASILYAAHLGDPDTQAVRSGNVALRHDFGFAAPPRSARSSVPWRLPVEEFGSKNGWRVRGSLLGLEAALGRLALRRIDPTVMPAEPMLGPNDTHTLTLTAALLNPHAMTNAARDEIAAALGRGRARAAALTTDPAGLDRAARDAGIDEWRRQALAWTTAHEPQRLVEQFSLVELFWLGAPRPSLLRTMDAWGAAAYPLSGCLCLEMPRVPVSAELGGRPSAGLQAIQYADVALQLADTLASLDLPASLAAAVMSFALQDVIDRTRPAYPGDATAFGRAAATLPRDQIVDYIAALTAGGPLVPVDSAGAGR